MSASPEGPNQTEDEAFAAFLLERGRLQVDQASRALRLLGRYQQRAPSARLVHVLPKHAFLSREDARHEWRRFQGSVAARRLTPDPLADEAPEAQSDQGAVDEDEVDAAEEAVAVEASEEPIAVAAEEAVAEASEEPIAEAAEEAVAEAEPIADAAEEVAAEAAEEAVAEASEEAVAEASEEAVAGDGEEVAEASEEPIAEAAEEAVAEAAEPAVEEAEPIADAAEEAVADEEEAVVDAAEESVADEAVADEDAGAEEAVADAEDAGAEPRLPPQRTLVWTGDEDDLIRPSGRHARVDVGAAPAFRPPAPAFGRAPAAAPPLPPFELGPPAAQGQDPFAHARPRGFAIGAPAPARPRRRRASADYAPTLFEDDPLPRVAGELAFERDDDPWEAPGYTPERRSSPWWWVLVGASGVALVASLVYAVDAVQVAAATPEARFLDEVDGLSPQQVLQRAALLPEGVRGSPTVVARVGEAQEALAREGSQRAEAVFAELSSATEPAERVAVCDRALEAWGDYVPALVTRARARLRLHAAQVANGTTLTDPWGAAREDLSRALELEPERTEALLLRAELAARDGDSNLAEGCWRKALEADPAGGDGLFALGRLAEDQGRWEAACAGYADALATDPQHVAARVGLARAELRRGRAAQALSALQGISDVEPLAGEARALAALAYWQQDERVRCDRSLEQALERAPGSALALGLKAFVSLPRDWRGRSLADAAERVGAERLAHAALRVDARAPWAHLTLGLLGEGQAALRHANRALEGGGGAEAHLLRGRLRLERQDRSGSEDLRRVSDLPEALPRQRALANLLLADMFLGLRRADEALRYATRAFEEHPLPEALLLRGRIYAAAQHLREAEEDLRRATSEGPRLVDAWFERGKVLRELDVPSRALECLDQAEGLLREGERASFSRSLLAFERGRIYSDLDEYAAAIKHLRAFLAQTETPTSDAEGISRSRIDAMRLIELCERRLTGGR